MRWAAPLLVIEYDKVCCGLQSQCNRLPLTPARAGVGHHASPASSPAGVRPASHCPCPLSPRTLRFERSPRQGAWSRRRRARRGRVSPPFAPLQSRLKSSPPAFPKRPSRGHCPAAPVRLHPPPSCAACPGRAQLLYALRRAAPAGYRAPSASRARGGHRRGGQGGRREKWLYISYTYPRVFLSS
jgi:hypothetical protein